MAIKLGMNAKLYRNTGDYAAPIWAEMPNVKDVNLSLETGEADVTVRGNAGWRATLATLRGHGVEILGDIDLAVEMADMPTLKDAVADDDKTIVNVPENPWPMTYFPSPSLSILGEIPVYDGGAQGRGFLVDGRVSFSFGDAAHAVNGWLYRAGLFYAGFGNAYVKNGFLVGGRPQNSQVSLLADNTWFAEGVVGVDTDSCEQSRITLKCRETYFGGNGCQCTVGSNVAFLDVDGCWITNIDARSHHPSGWVRTLAGGIRNTLFFGNVMRLGGSPAVRDIRLDANSHASLMSRKGPAGADWDETNIRFVLADEAGGVAYDSADGQTGVWDGDAPADLQEAVRRIAVALQAQIGGPIA